MFSQFGSMFMFDVYRYFLCGKKTLFRGRSLGVSSFVVLFVDSLLMGLTWAHQNDLG